LAFISGRVVDSKGKALESVTVTLDTGRVARTGSDGTFKLEERMGEITIHFTLDGFKKETVEVHAKPGDLNWAGTIKLEKEREKTKGKVSNWISDPVNLMIIASVLVLLIIISAFLWRMWDRENYADVDIEMEDDIETR
jgi:hypothetical protein